ncbi:dTMP kinase [Nitratidesulfovibrio sp. SRB-5]|uniref:dTMP kinase n=1 Tax=Nitratidesulfovibrio sp. SRB-5 TaxID=2872636 RepID=UPI001026BC08|nr:dTMP kinase [Nitratidesulfovibrio sp. SRB-5]MBZ2171406.1 dTMP kinase [Nitratidesulfovibrio sp. SRB-5]RXF77626.1 dTMP kinase [Desulfovibrio sp. DS-1]
MFITFEGMEGSGKSTALNRVQQALLDAGHGVLLTREPGGSRLGRTLRSILLDLSNDDIVPEAELFLYLADRAQHVGQVIRPALEEGVVVLSDRYADSTVVYQGYGRGLDPERLRELNDMAVGGLWPDLTLVFDLPPEEGLRRAMTRNLREGTSVSEGRFEAEHLAFHARVREGYLTWAALHPARFRVVDATRTPDEVFEDVMRAVRSALSAPARP